MVIARMTADNLHTRTLLETETARTAARRTAAGNNTHRLDDPTVDSRYNHPGVVPSCSCHRPLPHHPNSAKSTLPVWDSARPHQERHPCTRPADRILRRPERSTSCRSTPISCLSSNGSGRQVRASRASSLTVDLRWRSRSLTG